MSSEGARLMSEAAERAGEEALALMGKIIEAGIPDDDAKANQRRIGALVTAATCLYASILGSVAKTKTPSLKKLTLDMAQEMVDPALTILGEMEVRHGV